MGGDHSNIILFGLRHSLVLNIKQVQIYDCTCLSVSNWTNDLSKQTKKKTHSHITLKQKKTN